MVAQTQKHSPQLAPQSAPWFAFFHENGEDQSLFSLSERVSCVINIPDMYRKRCFGSSHGWLLVLDETSGDFFLLNPISMQKIQLPPSQFESYDFSSWILSSPPTDPDSVLILTAPDEYLVLFCRIGDQQWTHQEYKLEEDFITDIVSCNGTLYARTYFGKLAILDFTAPSTLRILEAEEPPWPQAARQVKHYLMESLSELFLVRMVYRGFTREVHFLEVYKLDFSTMVWVEVESLGDRVFLLGRDMCTSCSATETRLKRDCIYFLDDGGCMNAFDLEDVSILFDWPCPDVRRSLSPPFFIIPAV
ncbi:F-box/kelch-repeat protein At1g57790-like [Tasmannia lanceolata]|uniref:F-box/kelch-repeat protein At1g57790-like n=1 Tax=Tasmannia lanceolata TaxID=3420 RepID=UPI0040634E67